MVKYKETIRLITFYFAFEQLMIGSKVDIRYDGFFATILDRHSRLPNNMVIASWNYDLQLELAFQDYLSHQEIGEARYRLKQTTPFGWKHGIAQNDEALVHKINGSIGIHNSRNGDSFTDLVNYSSGFNANNVASLINNTFNLKNQLSMSFAWEDGIKSEPYRKLLLRANTAHTLVVV